MSLLLRQAGQTILDQYKIPNFHVGINSDNKMTIQSECGKPFVTIQGIQFNRSIPSAQEITFAVELLDGYMATHIQTIQAYLKAQTTFQKKKRPATDKRFGIAIDFNHYTKSSHKPSHYQIIIYRDDILNIKHSITNKKVKTTIQIHSNKTSLQKITNYKTDKKLQKEALTYLKAHHKYHKEKYDLEELKQKLSVCNI